MEDRRVREQERLKRQHEIEKRRVEQLERDSRRWDAVENGIREAERRRQRDTEGQRLGIRKTANTNGYTGRLFRLPYNPINLQY